MSAQLLKIMLYSKCLLLLHVNLNLIILTLFYYICDKYRLPELMSGKAIEFNLLDSQNKNIFKNNNSNMWEHRGFSFLGPTP